MSSKEEMNITETLSLLTLP